MVYVTLDTPLDSIEITDMKLGPSNSVITHYSGSGVGQGFYLTAGVYSVIQGCRGGVDHGCHTAGSDADNRAG